MYARSHDGSCSLVCMKRWLSASMVSEQPGYRLFLSLIIARCVRGQYGVPFVIKHTVTHWATLIGDFTSRAFSDWRPEYVVPRVFRGMYDQAPTRALRCWPASVRPSQFDQVLRVVPFATFLHLHVGAVRTIRRLWALCQRNILYVRTVLVFGTAPCLVS